MVDFFVIWIRAIFGTLSSHFIAQNTVLRQLSFVVSATSGLLHSSSFSSLTFLELNAAFDTIDHNIPLIRLENAFAICDLALFFCSYMQGRTQVVTVSEEKILSFAASDL